MYLIIVNDFDGYAKRIRAHRAPSALNARSVLRPSFGNERDVFSSFFLSFFSFFFFLYCFEIRATERDLFLTFSMTSAELTLFSACYHMFST